MNKKIAFQGQDSFESVDKVIENAVFGFEFGPGSIDVENPDVFLQAVNDMLFFFRDFPQTS